MLQWLQNYLSSAGSAGGSPSSSAPSSTQSTTDTASISQQAVQLNADSTESVPDPSQLPDLSQLRAHHPHHHHHGGEHGQSQEGGSFIDQLAKSIVTNLQQATGSDASSQSNPSTESNGNDDSFLEKLATAISNDLLAKYQQSTGSESTASSTGDTNQVSAIA
jgi:hypothetical protein